MNPNPASPFIAGACLLAAAGCTFPSSTSVVPRHQANQIQTADTGIVINVREVTIEGRKTFVGRAGGAAVGAAVAAPDDGHRGDRGERLAQVGAAIVGSVVGEAVEEAVTRKRAQEITLRMKDGRTISITQEAPPEYRIGDEVTVIHSRAGARIAQGP
jgi:outer membrane lipoprotein SlyB